MPNQKIERDVDEEVLVKNFHLSDEISRLMLGKKDYITVVENGDWKHIQKILVLSNIKEAFNELEVRY